MRKFLWLLLSPLAVWTAWGATVQAHPENALDYFPLFWLLNDLAVLLAFLALFLWATGYGKAESPASAPAASPAAGSRGGQRHP